MPTDEPKLSWVFRRSTYTNDPETGARVGQYARKDPVEPLDDQRLVTSSYRRMRSENRGRDGSMDTTYVVQGWGTGGGELGGAMADVQRRLEGIRSSAAASSTVSRRSVLGAAAVGAPAITGAVIQIGAATNGAATGVPVVAAAGRTAVGRGMAVAGTAARPGHNWNQGRPRRRRPLAERQSAAIAGSRISCVQPASPRLRQSLGEV